MSVNHERAARGPGDPPPPALRMRGITARFGALTANDRVDFDVRPGEIHGLLGENGAGKSTLMNVLFGLVEHQDGVIEVAGRRVEIDGPAAARQHGLGMVHQHFQLVGNLTGAENVALAHAAGRLRRVRLSALSDELRALSARLGLAVDPGVPTELLSVGEQQRLEIVKALHGGARLLILDEPTAVLTPPEWEGLASVLRELARAGTSVVLISHKLEEITGVTDRCTVLRHGRVAGVRDTAGTSKAELAALMVGRDVEFGGRRLLRAPGAPVLRVDRLALGGLHGGGVRGVSFDVRAGEIVGVAGVEGNGQRELVAAICGMRAPDEGSVSIGGASPADPRAFAALGGAVVPEDRLRDAVAARLSVADNLLLCEYRTPAFSHRGVLRPAAIRRRSSELLRRFDVRGADPGTRFAQLSGGNQQKAVLARELARDPKLLVAAQPTRGLDVGACQFVHEQLNGFKAGGGATLLISAELDEIFALADRVAVLYDGEFLDIVDADEADIDRIGRLMAGDRSLA